MSVSSPTPKREDTRDRLVQAAFWEIYRNGFRSAGMDRILSEVGVTKGALYHHFKGKHSLGYAVVEEMVGPMIYQFWVQPLENSSNPIDTLKELEGPMDGELSDLIGQLGCPLNNLSQEMSGLDPGFHQRLSTIFQMWQEGIAQALRRGQEQGSVRKDLDPDDSAAFLVAALEGRMALAKAAQSPDALQACKRSLALYLDTLRA